VTSAPPELSRARALLRELLGGLAHDASAALAFAQVYEELSPQARAALLEVVEADLEASPIPPVAVWAPLLAVEREPERRAALEARLAASHIAAPSVEPRALLGAAPDGSSVAALVMPAYLRFVRVLWCRARPSWGFLWARHDALMHEREVPSAPVVDGVTLEPVPAKIVVDALAHAVLAHERRGEPMPPSVAAFADAFAPDPHSF
jgi:hypothetical protein